ncbi:AAA domain-containing protein [Empedobacter falsenii]
MNQKPLKSSEDFTQKYERGTVVELSISAIIKPSQIILKFDDGFIGRLSILDLSWNLPESEAEFKNLKIGDRIRCVILSVNFVHKQVLLSQKFLYPQISETLAWEHISRGDEYDANIIESYSKISIVKTKNNLYGIINNKYLENNQKLRVKVDSKLDDHNLIHFIPASLDIQQVENNSNLFDTEISFIEEELRSFNKFEKSILGVNASDEELALINKGFLYDVNIFSKVFKSEKPLYIQFESGHPSYELIFKQNALPYFLNNEVNFKNREKKVLEKLSNQPYWFKLNLRDEDKKIEFSIYNEEINFFGDVKISKDKKDIKFIIKDFSFGHKQSKSSEAKKRNEKFGSFMFNNPLKVVDPLGVIPFDETISDFLDYAILKTKCFETVNLLKKRTGEILRQEGTTLTIIDKFLEYQISLIDDQKINNVFVENFDRVPSINNGVAIKIPNEIDEKIDLSEDAIVNIRLKDKDKLMKLSEGIISNLTEDYILSFNQPINLELLKDGFYLDKRISKKQFQIQRDIIKDFFEKKIKIDHIESLLLKGKNANTPIIKSVKFKNETLAQTEKEDNSNNQILAVKKAVGNQNIFLIQGPPGTGKTTVIAEIVQQLVEKGEKVLVAGQNHVSVDNVLDKLAEFSNLNLLRVGNPDRIDKNLLKYNIENITEQYKIDFKKFIANHLKVAEKYLEKRAYSAQPEEIKEELNIFINALVKEYGVLKESYKQKHFILIEGLEDLKISEISSSIEVLKKWIQETNNEYETLLKPLIYNSIDVVFATCIGIKSDQILKSKNFKFDTVIIDEAGKANIAETLVAMELGKKVILVGDQKQLPPYMESALLDVKDPNSFPNSSYGKDYIEDDISHALKTSFFEFIVNRINAGEFPKENMIMLNYQHRMHPNIGEFVSHSFYEGEVRMGNKTHLNKLDLPAPFNKEVIFFDTSNAKYPFEQNNGFSAMNNTEAETISEIILPKLFDHEMMPENIAIIAPYKSQVTNINNHINNSNLKFKNIDVSTLDSFQGKEYDIIIFSFTRSSDHTKPKIENGKKRFTKVGFLDDARRLNVAFSRAKKKLILIGNAKTLTDKRSHFDRIFDYTNLFKKLVELSKKDKIGNFINLADIQRKNSQVVSFKEIYNVGEKVKGIAKEIGISEKTGKPYGLFVEINGQRALAPHRHKNQILNKYFSSYKVGDELNLIITEIDPIKKHIMVELISDHKHNKWQYTIGKYKKGDIVKGRVINKVDFGYFLRMDTGYEGLLHLNKIRNNKLFQLNDEIQVKIIQIDFNKKQISFSY